jgi:outer membrane protein assembly factor BamB
MTHRLFLLLVIVFSAVPLSLQAGNWTEFRGPTGQGRSVERDLPIEWTETENVVWKVDIPGSGWSSPIVYNGRVYLTAAVGRSSSGQSLRALCLDAASGREIWNIEVFRQRFDRIHNKNSHASPTPITDGKHLFVHFGTHGTACLTLDGKIVWSNRKLVYRPTHGNGGSPVLVDDLLIVSCDGSDVQFVVALDRSTGKIRWRKRRPAVLNSRKFSFGTPLVITVKGKKQVISVGTDLVIAYEPKTGRNIWRVTYDGYSVIPRPVYGHGLVYICTGWIPPKLLVIRPDGRGDVTDTHIQWTSKKAVPNTPSPLLVGDELYFISDGGIATCVDAKTGREHWQRRVGGNFSASPVFADGKIYFQSEQGEATVIKAGRKYIVLARNRFPGERTLASYAVADSALFIRTDQNLYRISKR